MRKKSSPSEFDYKAILFIQIESFNNLTSREQHSEAYLKHTLRIPFMATRSFSPIRSFMTLSFPRASNDSESDFGNLRSSALRSEGFSSVS